MTLLLLIWAQAWVEAAKRLLFSMLFYMERYRNKTMHKLIKTTAKALNAGGLKHRLHGFATP